VVIMFNGLSLFESGPSETEPGALESRDAVGSSPGVAGSHVVGQGVQPRRIVQRGRLVADDDAAMRSQIDAIAAQVGRGSATLIDEHGQAWPGCIMQRFDPAPAERLGPRLSASYTITYLQASP